jgi:hypothetical protein
MSAGRSGRARTDERGNSVWEFVDEHGCESTVRTERVLALGDGLSLAQTGMFAPPAPPASRPAPVAEPAAPRLRKPLSRQELQKLSDEILRQRKLREAAQGDQGDQGDRSRK